MVARPRSKSDHHQHQDMDQPQDKEEKAGKKMEVIKDPRRTKSYGTLSRMPMTPKLARFFKK